LPVYIFNKENQVSGSFNNGEILEKKPIGFPQEGGNKKPYSNLFYWAHAWTPGAKSTIALHPHQGFEICSFVLNGSIKHYDSKEKKWILLNKGDVQIIRAGSGISHAEEILDNSEIFQIWFDPDISKTLNKPASYNDYKSNEFPIVNEKNMETTIICGKNSPFKMETEKIEIKNHKFKSGDFSFDLNSEFVYSFFVREGNLIYNEKNISKGDFFIVEKENFFNFRFENITEIFEVKSPLSLSYSTYFDRFSK
jgi:redox-sensitive bicupin YhaK (pirin superfamily)